MNRLEKVSLIIDLGKTNIKFYFVNKKTLKAKIFIFKNQIIKKNKIFEVDIDYIKNILLKLLKKNSKKYIIKNINFTTHGSVLIGLDANYEIITKISDENVYSNKVNQEYREIIKKDNYNFSELMPRGYNLGKQIMYLSKYKKDTFKKIKFFLPFPQFLSFIVTNKICFDKVYINNHSHLWNFSKNKFSSLGKKSKIKDKIPYFSNVVKNYSKVGNEEIKKLLNSKDTRVFSGMHDSSSCLYFHKKNYKKKFILISSGTWVVIYFEISKNEIYKDLYKSHTINSNYSNTFNLSLRFPYGKIYSKSFIKSQLINHYKIDLNTAKQILIENFKINQKNIFTLKSFKKIKKYKTNKKKYYYLFFLFALQIAISIILKNDRNTIIIDGVFAKNKIFLFFLTNLLKNKVLVYKETDGVAMGALSIFSKIPKEKYKLKEIKKNKKFVELLHFL